MITRAFLVTIAAGTIGAALLAGCQPEPYDPPGNPTRPAEIVTYTHCDKALVGEPCVKRVTEGTRHQAPRWYVYLNGKGSRDPRRVPQCDAQSMPRPCLQLVRSGGRTTYDLLGHHLL